MGRLCLNPTWHRTLVRAVEDYVYKNKSWCSNIVGVDGQRSPAVEFQLYYLPREFTSVLIAAVYISPRCKLKNGLQKLYDIISRNQKQPATKTPHFLILANQIIFLCFSCLLITSVLRNIQFRWLQLSFQSTLGVVRFWRLISLLIRMSSKISGKIMPLIISAMTDHICFCFVFFNEGQTLVTRNAMLLIVISMQHQCYTSFQKNSPDWCYRLTEQQQAHGWASIRGTLQLQLPPCKKHIQSDRLI